MIPDCYEPWAQEERRQRLWDELMKKYHPRCHLCEKLLYPGDRFRVASSRVVCVWCAEELEEAETRRMGVI